MVKFDVKIKDDKFLGWREYIHSQPETSSTTRPVYDQARCIASSSRSAHGSTSCGGMVLRHEYVHMAPSSGENHQSSARLTVSKCVVS
jgi:hypothetical protein